MSTAGISILWCFQKDFCQGKMTVKGKKSLTRSEKGLSHLLQHPESGLLLQGCSPEVWPWLLKGSVIPH